MNLNRLSSLLSALALTLFFFVIGICSILLPWVPYFQRVVLNFVVEEAALMALLGFTFILIALGISAYTLSQKHHRYHQIKGGTYSISIDETLIGQYVDAYWKELLPNNEISSSISIKNNEIHIDADLPSFPYEEQKPLLERVEHDLTTLFQTHFGYRKEYTLSISFQE